MQAPLGLAEQPVDLLYRAFFARTNERGRVIALMRSLLDDVLGWFSFVSVCGVAALPLCRFFCGSSSTSIVPFDLPCHELAADAALSFEPVSRTGEQ